MPFPIKASAGGMVSAIANSWYSIKASAGNTAEIWIYDEIGGWGISARRFAQELTEKGDIKNITLRIHSPGGDVFEGMAIYNLLANHPATITVYIDGLAASMASVIAMAGDTIIMPENSMMMIHKPWGITGGDADDMRSYADLMDKVEANLITAYTKKTGKSADEVAALLASETWMTAAEAVAMGFADQTSAALQVAASLKSKRLQDFKNMPKEFQQIFKPRAQTTVPPIVTPVSDTTTVPVAATEAEIRAKILAENKTRTDAITNLFGNFGNRHSDIQASCIADLSCTVEQAKDKLLAALGRNTTPSTPNNNAHIYADNGNIVGDSVRNAVMSRAGHEQEQADNHYVGMTLRELARVSLTDRGIGIAGLQPMNMVGLAFTHSTSDFGAILLDTANKSVLQGWEFAEETFEKWTKKGQLSDFKTATRVGMGAFPSLREVRQGAEYQYVSVGDRASTICLATYGEIFSLTRQCIINDDMQMLTDIPMKMGMAAKGTIGDLVYAVL
ncbi:MAG: ClpP-like prohead protease/major capsid protein fusion protein, partial [Plesiomonas sp.]